MKKATGGTSATREREGARFLIRASSAMELMEEKILGKIRWDVRHGQKGD